MCGSDNLVSNNALLGFHLSIVGIQTVIPTAYISTPFVLPCEYMRLSLKFIDRVYRNSGKDS